MREFNRIDLPQEILTEVEHFAYLYMSAPEIAILCQVPEEDFMADLENTMSAIYRAFKTGRLRRKAEFTTAVMKLSDQLSSPAMKIEQEIMMDTYLDDQTFL